ncbi:MAG: MarR family transcriptional regulator [Selenomonas sp.]|uniref:MarR family winged helix-turn-helix transcriptional regulator n=1 Tax=Selenomonas sp. TaxID=2053611 RepID=UPI0025E132B9|nr:MarR family transcriptional regulator [Selenomonas sp.]MCR5756548.1 MarR family transcriptional regulator [Selenomonas sp.]
MVNDQKEDANKRLGKESMINETTGYKICRTARKIHQYMTNALAEFDITPEQWVVLQIVREEKGLSQQQLAERLEKDKNSTKALVDRLLKKGLLQRQKSEVDRRLYQLNVTNAGFLLAEKIILVDHVFMQALEDTISQEELTAFVNTLTKLEKNITQTL